jgi:ectoine hydroxylase-related dioxygenase (phytanoyl-CoA dioxygenase family)
MEPMRALSENDVAHYHREGYVLVRQLIPRALCDEVFQTAMDRQGGRFVMNDWTRLVFDHGDPDADPALHPLLIEQGLIAIVEQLLASPARVQAGMVAILPPGGGRGLHWHQENQYIHILHHALNSFIAVSDIAPEQGTLWIAPRSHLYGVLPSEEAADFKGHRRALKEPENGVPMPHLSAGDACIFNRNTLHRSLTNNTDRPRVAYAAQYVHEDARVAATGLRDPRQMLVRELSERWSISVRA